MGFFFFFFFENFSICIHQRDWPVVSFFGMSFSDFNASLLKQAWVYLPVFVCVPYFCFWARPFACLFAFTFIYLFSVVLGLHCSSFSSCGEHGLLFVVFPLGWLLLLWNSGTRAHELNSCGFWPLQYRLSSCGHGFSCSMECGIFSQPLIKPVSAHWQVDSLPLSHQGIDI